MKQYVNKDNFLKALQKASNIIGTRSTLAVPGKCTTWKLTLTTADLELRIMIKIEAEIEMENVNFKTKNNPVLKDFFPKAFNIFHRGNS